MSDATSISDNAKAAADVPNKDAIATDVPNKDAPSFFGDISTQNMVYIATGFLIVYAIIYGLTSIAGSSTADTSSMLATSRSIDMVSLVVVIAATVIYYHSFSDDQKNDIWGTMLDETKAFYDDPNSTAYMLILMAGFYLIVYTCGIPMTSATKSNFIWFVEVHLWYFILTLAIDYVMKRYLDVPLADIIIDKTRELMVYFGIIKKPASPAPVSKKQSGGTVEPAINKSEVFNISNNIYTYDDAQAICGAYGATMATYDQVEDAYKDGGEWCNYGWSAGQMALFPTQKKTWAALQGTDDHKHDCGRPGINGGYISNPFTPFGVNCYGVKPAGSVSDLATLTEPKMYPKTKDDLIAEAKVKYWKKHADKMLVLNSFNNSKWSEY
jgi:hypothetical protein